MVFTWAATHKHSRLPSHSVISRDDEASSSLFLSLSRNTPLNRQQCWISKGRGGLMLLDEADWVNLSTWWTFCGLGSCSPADCRLQSWQKLFRCFSRSALKQREIEVFYCSVSGGGGTNCWTKPASAKNLNLNVCNCICSSPTGRVYGVGMNSDPF